MDLQEDEPVLLEIAVFGRGALREGFARSVNSTKAIAVTAPAGTFDILGWLRAHEEGITWCRGHDRASPQAQALQMAIALRT